MPRGIFCCTAGHLCSVFLLSLLLFEHFKVIEQLISFTLRLLGNPNRLTLGILKLFLPERFDIRLQLLSLFKLTVGLLTNPSRFLTLFFHIRTALFKPVHNVLKANVFV